MGCAGSADAGDQRHEHREAPRRYEVAPAIETKTNPNMTHPSSSRRASAVVIKADDEEYQLLVEVDRMSSTSGGYTAQEPSRSAQRHMVSSRMREARQRESGSGICPNPHVAHAPGELERVNSRVREWFPGALTASGSSALVQHAASSHSFSWDNTPFVSTSIATAAAQGNPSASEFPPPQPSAAADTASDASHASRLSRANLAAHLQSSGSSTNPFINGNAAHGGRLVDDPSLAQE
jgi:hypothetical protein